MNMSDMFYICRITPNLRGILQKMIQRQQIKAARCLLDWSRHDLGERSGVSDRTIARFEAGEGDITVGKLEKLERALLDAGVEFVDGGVVLQSLKRKARGG